MEAFAEAFWELSVDMGIYILFGLMAAGVLHQLIDEELVRKHLGRNSSGSVIKGAFFGTPLPLCSCSVIPFAASLRRSGASKGSTLSFLISTPVIGIDSMLATYGMFGWVFTIYRVATSAVLATVAGLMLNRLDTAEPSPPAVFSAVAPASAGMKPVFKIPPPARKPFSFAEVFAYGFGTLLGSFSKPLFWGLVIGAIIAAAVPENLQTLLGENRWAGYLIAAAISAPMYVCATASLPIAASLIVAGVSPGAAFVFLTSGPATNTVTMGVVKSMLGIRALVVYLSVILVGSIVFGILIDIGFEALSIEMTMLSGEEHGLYREISAAVLLVLLGWHLLTARFFQAKGGCDGGSCCS